MRNSGNYIQDYILYQGTLLLILSNISKLPFSIWEIKSHFKNIIQVHNQSEKLVCPWNMEKYLKLFLDAIKTCSSQISYV